MNKINLAEKFSKISEYWKPYIAAELNGQHVKLDKLKGEFVFHHHENEDELFLVVKGRFRMEYGRKGSTATNGSKKVNSLSSPAASSIAPSPTKNAGYFSSSPLPH